MRKAREGWKSYGYTSSAMNVLLLLPSDFKLCLWAWLAWWLMEGGSVVVDKLPE
jgi:hypothetical protein